MKSASKRALRTLVAAVTGLQTLLVSGLVLAQSQGVDINVNTTRDVTWYGQWWVWALGIAVFLIIVVALTSRGRSA